MVKLKTAIIFLGDIIFLYTALALTLLIRYGTNDFYGQFYTHVRPFSVIFFLWILIFYIADLYDIRTLKSSFEIARNLGTAILISIIVSITLFYLLAGFFELTPKTNLAIFAVIFSILDFGWRTTAIKFRYAKTKLLFMGESKTIVEIVSYLKSNPQIGYKLEDWINNYPNAEKIKEIIKTKEIEAVVVLSELLRKDPGAIKTIYEILPLKVEVINSYDFYETIFQREPLNDLPEEWFVGKVSFRKNFYDSIKRALDILLGLTLLIILSPLIIFVAVLVKITSTGPAIYKQKRTGKNGQIFTLYKFRTMKDKNSGPLWTTNNDNRITGIGNILRFSHLDEIPQLWNIVKGNISFIGPRAERIELVETYKKLPHYEIRHAIKPGLTGWAQINYRASASLEEAFEKLKYDIFYIKNRSFALDLIIIIKTARLFFSNPE